MIYYFEYHMISIVSQVWKFSKPVHLICILSVELLAYSNIHLAILEIYEFGTNFFFMVEQIEFQYKWSYESRCHAMFR